MTEYVAGLLFTRRLSGVALIRKTHPAWQAGKLNGIGGHIEDGEEPFDTMYREFKEETGFTISGSWMPFARLQGDSNGGWAVHFFWAVNTRDDEIRSMTEEQAAWYSVADIIAGKEQTIPNLRWLLPMALNDIQRLDNCSLFDIHEKELYR